MSARSQARRQARQSKAARRWGDSLTPINKKGQVPASTQPYNRSSCDILKPSREGLGNPSA